MPVTARLSKLFCERLGEQVANELVDWFNAVDATYKAELKEFNELNFARFDAKVDQRIAELRSYLEARIGEVRTDVSGVRTDMAALKAELVKWMFLFWAGTALAGLLLR